MKRTENKLKSKGIKAHMPNDEHAYWSFKYDRHYVVKHYSEVSHLSFSRGSKRGWYMWCDEHPNLRLISYLRNYFPKQVGRKTNDVLRDFSKLGWKTSQEMYYYWDGFVDGNKYGYYSDESHRLMQVLED